jgi:hypothetical protein
MMCHKYSKILPEVASSNSRVQQPLSIPYVFASFAFAYLIHRHSELGATRRRDRLRNRGDVAAEQAETCVREYVLGELVRWFAERLHL